MVTKIKSILREATEIFLSLPVISPEYDSPKIEKEEPFALNLTMGTEKGFKVRIGHRNQCPLCAKPLSDGYGRRYCHNRKCILLGLVQN